LPLFRDRLGAVTATSRRAERNFNLACNDLWSAGCRGPTPPIAAREKWRQSDGITIHVTQINDYVESITQYKTRENLTA